MSHCRIAPPACCAIATFCLSAFHAAHGSGRAFPAAEGFGAKVKGGGMGKVIWVTNLEARGPGSLREAVDTPGPRIVKFRVAGTVELGRDALRVGFPFRPKWKELRKEGVKDTEMDNPCSFLTIDGTSAPPPGITINGNLSLGPYGLEQVIVRNLRIRDNGMTPRSSSDCLGIYARHVLVDHCSLQWARDEVASVWYGNGHDVTVQWCTIGPGWGTHALGFLSGSGTDRITLHHCLFANNVGRNPRVCGNSRTGHLGKFRNDTPTIDVRNNVVYNWFNVGTAQIASGAHCNMVGNLYLPGPDSATNGVTILAYCSSRTKPTVLCLKGNICPQRPSDDLDEWAGAGHYVSEGGRSLRKFGPHAWGQKRDTPFPAPPVATHSAQAAKALVLSQAGAWPRDPVDAGLVRTVLHNTGSVGVKNTLPSDFSNARPLARATATSVADKDNLTVTFHAEANDADGEILMHTWDFGDGRRAIGKDVEHTYVAPGEYVATLFVVDDIGMGATSSVKVAVGKGALVAQALEPPAVVASPEPSAPAWQAPAVALGGPLAGPPTQGDWAGAVTLTPFVNQATWKVDPNGQVDARLLRDRSNLYLRVTTAGIPAASLKSIRVTDTLIAPPRHGFEYVAVPKVTIFLSPRYGRTPWYRFVVDTRGSRHDAKGADRKWNPAPDWGIMSNRVDQKWQMTGSIPLQALGVAAPADHAWGIKLMVNTGKDVIYIWPPVGSAGKDLHCVPHTSDPIYYAKLSLVPVRK